ncbi:hypothetical protein TREMEDRAFT_45200 [Tremella mesenterica DSM 1558]|uniref:uncharacterized protein n=1 Tax=Tremella mesenterica (strain ATCC 24925 / CBS 8224 / DSM 1558 / NBRC 9311 / NRRL Y-6157 / RJB 2259-6 / UBC 559-6) TaxID=578456 RepID=UPI0003F4915A|nr:uncharacterized protein TREMEDRAFT_45200 [Tremella mesenterica DSM 1558]EIW67708.1 hypothetical protein TREMEDRAFT_45200 [Tremella mesenterica DSM 1558]
MGPPPAVTLTAPQSPARARSVSQSGVSSFVHTHFESDASSLAAPRSGFFRSQSTNLVSRSSTLPQSGVQTTASTSNGGQGRARSSSLVTVTEVGGDEPENVVDRLGVGTNENANWVNAPGAWIIHPVLILVAKVLIDAIPGMTQDVGWTCVNLGYMAVSFLMFHHVTGVPFESTIATGGAYDELTLWEQIDAGAQYTPAKKWLTSVPIGLFLISTHYTRYDYILFALNFAALCFVLFPKLPILHRLRFHFLPASTNTDAPPTPLSTRPSTPNSVVDGSAMKPKLP